MKPRTPDDFDDLVNRELAWRRKELVDIHLVVISAQEPLQTALRRAAVAMAYAHWEGFVKIACQAYLDFVALRKLRLGELAPCFAALALRRSCAQNDDQRPLAQEITKVRVMRGEVDHRVSIHKHKVVDARSNLSSAVLRDVLDALGLPTGPFESKYNFIDHKLLVMRNEIAHGRDTAPTAADYQEIHAQIMQMLSDLATEVRNAVTLGRYRVPATG